MTGPLTEEQIAALLAWLDTQTPGSVADVAADLGVNEETAGAYLDGYGDALTDVRLWVQQHAGQQG